MEVRVESMIYVWDDKIPTLFFEFVNLLTLSTGRERLRKSVKELVKKHELDRFFLYGFGSHHFYLHQRYTSDPEVVMKNRALPVHFQSSKKQHCDNTNDHQRSEHLYRSRDGEI